MNHYIENVTVSLENLISDLAKNPSLFLKNPDADFSRNRKIDFKTCVGITMNSGGCTMSKELLDFSISMLMHPLFRHIHSSEPRFCLKHLNTYFMRSQKKILKPKNYMRDINFWLAMVAI